MPTRTLKLKFLPFHLENRLCTKWGYAVEKRIPGEFIIFKKPHISDKSDDGLRRTIRASVNDNPLSGGSCTTVKDTKIVYPNFADTLTTRRKKALENECDNIVNFFADPYAVPESVRARLMGKMQKLTAPEAQFVLEYMDENFPLVDKGQ